MLCNYKIFWLDRVYFKASPNLIPMSLSHHACYYENCDQTMVV